MPSIPEVEGEATLWETQEEGIFHLDRDPEELCKLEEGHGC